MAVSEDEFALIVVGRWPWFRHRSQRVLQTRSKWQDTVPEEHFRSYASSRLVIAHQEPFCRITARRVVLPDLAAHLLSSLWSYNLSYYVHSLACTVSSTSSGKSGLACCTALAVTLWITTFVVHAPCLPRSDSQVEQLVFICRSHKS